MNKQEALWLLLLMIYQGTLGEDLGFLTLATTGTPTTALPNMQDDYSESISNVPGGGIPYLGNMSSTMVYVSDNGIISLNDSFVDDPQTPGSDFSQANGRGVVIIAPYWSDNDIRMSGTIRYETYETSHPSPLVQERLREISEFVSNGTGTTFSGVWMLLVEWSMCPPYPAGETSSMGVDPTFLSSTNTYQAIVITDSNSKSYAIFIYECNQIEWSGLDPIHARIGVSDGMGTSYVHPLSGNSSIVDIDCQDSSQSSTVNIFIDLNTFTTVGSLLVTSSITPSTTTVSTSIHRSATVSSVHTSSRISMQLSTVTSTLDTFHISSTSRISVQLLTKTTASLTLDTLHISSTIASDSQLRSTKATAGISSQSFVYGSVRPTPTSLLNSTFDERFLMSSIVVIIVPIVVLIVIATIAGIILTIGICVHKKQMNKIKPADGTKLIKSTLL